MVNNFIKKLVINLSIIFLFCFAICTNYSYAVSGKPGETVTVTYSINSPDGSVLSTVTGKLNYDSSLVECVDISSSAGISKNGTVSATESQIGGTSMTVTAKYKIKDGVTSNSISTSLVLSELYTKSSETNKAGSPIVANISVNLDNNGGEDNTPPPAATKSSNADLGNLGIRPNDFKGFKSGTTSYNVSVPNNVEQVTVYATAKDSKASVSGTGSKKLNVGENALNVVVTAEDGTQKTYTINVTREAEEANNTTENSNTVDETNTTDENTNTVGTDDVENPDMDLSNYDLTALTVAGYNLSPKFSPYIYEYTLDISSGEVKKLDIQTKTKNDRITVEIVGNEDLKEGENIVTILVSNEVTGENSTYQIIVNKTSEIDLSVVNEALNSNIEKANKIRTIIIGVILFIVVCVIIFAVVKYKLKNKYEEDDDDFDEYDNEEEKVEEYDEEIPKALQNEVKQEKDDNTNETKLKGLEDIKQKNKEKDDIIIQEPDELEERDYKKNSGRGKHF